MPKGPRKGATFGDYSLDPSTTRLQNRVTGEEVHTTPKLLALLQLFLDHAGEVVTKEEIMSEVWPDAWVSEGSVSRAVSNLRTLLGDDSRSPRYVETVPWTGYRFIEEVSRFGPEPRPMAAIFFDGDRHDLFEGENVIGRGRACDVVISSSFVSRMHAKISIDRDGVATIEDLGSRNGTTVDGLSVRSRTALRSAETIGLGNAEARYVSGQDVAGDDDLPTRSFH